MPRARTSQASSHWAEALHRHGCAKLQARRHHPLRQMGKRTQTSSHQGPPASKGQGPDLVPGRKARAPQAWAARTERPWSAGPETLAPGPRSQHQQTTEEALRATRGPSPNSPPRCEGPGVTAPCMAPQSPGHSATQQLSVGLAGPEELLGPLLIPAPRPGGDMLKT